MLYIVPNIFKLVFHILIKQNLSGIQISLGDAENNMSWNWSLKKMFQKSWLKKFNVGKSKGCIFKLLFYHSYLIGILFITDILIHLVQVQVGVIFLHFPLCFDPYPALSYTLFSTFCLTSFSTLLLCSTWKDKKNGRDLNRRPPGHYESALFIRPRQPQCPDCFLHLPFTCLCMKNICQICNLRKARNFG